jgi:type IV pilus assembly protein PilP
MKMIALRRPAWRRSLPVISARPAPAAAWPLAGALAAGVGLPAALLGPGLQEQTQSQALRAAELARTGAAALSRLDVARTRLHSAGAQPTGLTQPADAGQVRADRLILHRAALQHGLRVQVLKARGGSASAAVGQPGSPLQGLDVELAGSIEAASAYLTALGRSAWSFQRLEVLAGAAGQHRLVLQLEPLGVGSAVSAVSWALVQQRPLRPWHDPFAAVPAPAEPPALLVEPVVAQPSLPPTLPPAVPTPPPISPAMPSHWQAELERERQPLEAYALRDLFFAGTLRQGPSWLALVRAGGLIHTLRVGDYVGPDLGLVRSVDEEGLELREIGRDATGQWAESLRRWRVGVSP